MEAAQQARPVTTGGKRAKTRQTLIDAAAALVREKGFGRLSMEEVAARAGVSRGSIYGNFRDRNELFLAVAFDRSPPITVQPMPGATLREQMRAIGRAVAEAARKRRPNGVHRASYLMHVLADESLRQRVVAQGREIRRRIVEGWEMSLPAEPLPMPTQKFIRVISALTDGLMIAHFQSPEDYDEELIVSAFEALAGPGLAQPHP